MKADCVTDNAGAIYTFEAGEMGQNRLINVQNVRLRPSHPPRPRKLVPWAATSWRMYRKASVRVGWVERCGSRRPRSRRRWVSLCSGRVYFERIQKSRGVPARNFRRCRRDSSEVSGPSSKGTSWPGSGRVRVLGATLSGQIMANPEVVIDPAGASSGSTSISWPRSR